MAALPAFSEALFSAECEDGELLGSYAGVIDEPFTGVGTYGNGDGVQFSLPDNIAASVPGLFSLEIRGASSNDSAASIAAYWGDNKLGAVTFNGAVPATIYLPFKLKAGENLQQLRLVLESDSGANDTFIDHLILTRDGDIPPLPAAPTLPMAGAYETGQYRNLFAERGISAAEVQARVEAVYQQLFHSADLDNEALFIPVGDDMAYIWDTGNNDVRSEGMSYGMMMAVQMDRQEDFDRLWKWAHTYSLNREGDMKGYYAWQVTTDGQVRDKNPAPDGEEYFATALFFAAHRWGNGEGIFNYREQANIILDDMFDNGETRYANGGILESFSLFDHEQMQIVFSPATPSDRNWTDPSYHLPAFYELWARWADSNNAFWAELADSSRAFWKTTVHPETGLNPDYAYFDGTPHGDFQHWKDTFQYDAWRTVGNAAMDYYWWQIDPWQIEYANRLQNFFAEEGIDSYASLYELDGTPYENNTDHSPGLVAMNAMASLAADQQVAWEFIDAFWNTPIPTGKYRYYDGCLYMFAMLALSGNYKIYCPPGECDEMAVSSEASSQGSTSSESSSAASESSTSELSTSSLSSESSSNSLSKSSVSAVASSSSSATSSSARSQVALGSFGYSAFLLLVLLAFGRRKLIKAK